MSASIDDLLAGPPTGPCGRTLEYLEAIDKRGGKARRMDFLRIAGSEAATDRWISFLAKEKIVKEMIDNDGPRFYIKTEFGERFHQTLREHRIVKILLQHLSGRRLRP